MEVCVLIVGAGFAGVSCAKQLQKNGVNFLLIEGSNRKGGRTHTLTIPPTSNKEQKCWDIGASFIHGTEGNPLWDIVNDKKLQCANDFADRLDRSMIFEKPYRELSSTERKEIGLRYKLTQKKVFSYLRARLQKGKKDISILAGFNKILKKDPHPWQENSSEQLFWNYLLWIKEEYDGYNWDDVSILQHDGVASFPGENEMLEFGYQSLYTELTKDLAIRTGMEVKRIDYSGDSIVVTVKNHKEQTFELMEIKCQYLLCTVSIGVLQASLKQTKSTANQSLDSLETGVIDFVPPLPEWKCNSIESFGIGLLDKIVLQFPDDFNYENFDLTFVGEQAGEYPWIEFDARSNSALIWTGCRFADNMEMLDDKAIVGRLMEIIRYHHPDVPDPCFHYVTRWRQNPFTRGTYSYVRVGANQTDVANISLPVNNKIFFAGEATTGKDHLGTVHGAYLTGARQAALITSIINK